MGTITWHSTNNPRLGVSFAEAVDRGLAPDGGLYMPERLPRFPPEFFREISGISFQEISFQVAHAILGEEVPGENLRDIVGQSISFPAPLHALTGSLHVLELFHGPTLAFKDFGARFMARTLAYLHRNEEKEITILVATSGDTGSAVAHGFHNIDGIRVILLYPSGRVSTIQEMQLTTIGGNVTALEVDGTFDDCQRLVKQAFADRDIAARRKLSSANSINVARLVPQTFYYFNAYALAPKDGRRVVVSVPSGNLGNLTGGLFAWKMGLPVYRFIAATNANDVFTEYIRTGVYSPKKTTATISNAMDVGNPSNFARIQSLFDGDPNAVRDAVFSASFTDDATRKAIREIHDAYGYVMDPHGAVGFLAFQAFLVRHPGDYESILLETAHPSKFLDVFEESVRGKIEIPEHIRAALAGTKTTTRMPGAFEAFKSFLLDS